MDYGIFSTVTYTLISDDAETPYSMHSFDPPPELAGIVADLLEGFERIVQDPLALPVDPLPELVQAYETRLKTSPPHRGPSVDSMYSQVIAHHILDQVREVQELLTWTETSVDPMALAVIWGELTQDVRDARVRAMVRTYRLMRERSTAKDTCERVLGMMEHICWRIDLRVAEAQRKAPRTIRGRSPSRGQIPTCSHSRPRH